MEVESNNNENPTQDRLPSMPWRPNPQWSIWTPILRDYYHVVDNPSRLPSIFRPLFSKTPAINFEGHPTFVNFKFHLKDEHRIKRRIFLTLCEANMIVGGLGSLLIGVETGMFKSRYQTGPIASFVNQKYDKELSPPAKTAIANSFKAVSIVRKVAMRFILGGMLYDAIVRSREEKLLTDKSKRVVNASIAGGACGLLFGLRAGIPRVWNIALASSAAAALVEYTMKSKPTLFPKQRGKPSVTLP